MMQGNGFERHVILLPYKIKQQNDFRMEFCLAFIVTAANNVL
jgi:hypothetical protein